MDAASGQLVGGLVHDLTPVGDHQHATAASGNDGRRNDGLAGAGRRHEQDRPVATLDMMLELGGDVGLVTTQVDAHAANSASIGRNSTSESASPMMAWTRSSPRARTSACAMAISYSRSTAAILST